MTQEELDFILSSRTLTNYREDWPKERKGCLWYIGSQTEWPTVKVLDTFWRRDSVWQPSDCILPYELQLAQEQKDTSYLHFFGFIAVIVSYLFSTRAIVNTSQAEKDLTKIWESFPADIRSKWVGYYCFINLHGQTERHLLHIQSLLPFRFPDKGSLPDFVASFLNSKCWEHRDEYFNSIDIESKLFAAPCNVELPFRTDIIQNGLVEHEYGIHEFIIDGQHYYSKTHDEVSVHYSKAAHLLYSNYFISDPDYEWNEDDDEEDDTYVLELAKGIVAAIVNYCAFNHIIDNFNIKNNRPNKREQAPQGIHFHPDEMDYSIRVQEVFDTYFKHIIAQYATEHEDDAEYFLLSEDDKRNSAIAHYYQEELEGERTNRTYYAYLEPEQCETLQSYHRGFLTYLKNQLIGTRFVIQEPSNAADSPTFRWPSYAAKAADNDKQIFEDYLTRLCKSKKRSMTKDVKNYLKAKAAEGLIIRPEQTNTEYEYVRLFGYPYAESTYYGA